MIRRVLLVAALLPAHVAAQQPTEPGPATTVAAPASETQFPRPGRFGPALEPMQPGRFEVSAAAGTQHSYVQVQSTVLELTELSVSGLGNAGNAALEQQLRAALLAPGGLAALGESDSRRLSLSVSSKTPAGTELTTRWQAASGAEVTLTQTLLAGAGAGQAAAAGLVQISSSDPVQAARLRATLPYSPRDLSLALDAPYGLSLREGESQSRQAQRDLQPLLTQLTALLGRALDSNLPAPTDVEPLLTRRSTLFQGRNSRGNLLFQVQGQQARPWATQWSGALTGPLEGSKNSALASTATLARLSATVPAVSEFAQAIYRPGGLPDSAFEFGTLALKFRAQAGGADVQVGLQLRRTLALRPLGTPASGFAGE